MRAASGIRAALGWCAPHSSSCCAARRQPASSLTATRRARRVGRDRRV